MWCTKLSRAETEDERGRIEAEMQGSPDTSAILAALNATRTSARDRQNAMERSIREEARKLKQGEAGEQGLCSFSGLFCVCVGGGGTGRLLAAAARRADPAALQGYSG